MFEYIILVHNNSEIRSMLYEILTDLGYRVTTVLTHKELLDILKNERPDYIIINQNSTSPELEEILKEVRLIDENIKIIILDPDKNVFQIVRDVLKVLREKENSRATSKEPKRAHLKAKLLIVDDEKECTELLKNYFVRKGCNVDTALSGEEAILKVKNDKPDIVVLDIKMKGVDGIIVLKTIKDIDKSIIVIMTSVISDEQVVKEAMKLGANGYLVKPFNFAKLETTILNPQSETPKN